jgi:hypothetical protein
MNSWHGRLALGRGTPVEASPSTATSSIRMGSRGAENREAAKGAKTDAKECGGGTADERGRTQIGNVSCDMRPVHVTHRACRVGVLAHHWF